MRVAYIDMRNTSHQCPRGLTLFSRSSPPRRVCNVTRIGCVSTTFTVHGVEYSHVHGRIIGYQFDTPSAFYYHTYTIDQTYIYGVSLTLIFFFPPSNYGPSPFVVCRLATRVELIMPPLGIWDQLPVKVVRDHGDYEGDIIPV